MPAIAGVFPAATRPLTLGFVVEPLLFQLLPLLRQGLSLGLIHLSSASPFLAGSEGLSENLGERKIKLA